MYADLRTLLHLRRCLLRLLPHSPESNSSHQSFQSSKVAFRKHINSVPRLMIQALNHTIKLMGSNLNADTSTTTLHGIHSLHKIWVLASWETQSRMLFSHWSLSSSSAARKGAEGSRKSSSPGNRHMHQVP